MHHESICQDLHNTFCSKNDEENVFNLFKVSIGLVAVAIWVWCINGESNTISENGQQDQVFEGLPLYNVDAELSDWVFEGKAVKGAGWSIYDWLSATTYLKPRGIWLDWLRGIFFCNQYEYYWSFWSRCSCSCCRRRFLCLTSLAGCWITGLIHTCPHSGSIFLFQVGVST